jgi:hypothetical protein
MVEIPMSGEQEGLIQDDGWRRYLQGPETDGEFARRDEIALTALSELSSVVRPLLIEIRDCHRDENGNPVSEEEPNPLVRILMDARAEGRVVLRPKWSNPPQPIVVPELDLETLRRHLAERRAAPPGLRFDWRYLYVIAGAVRSLTPRDELRFKNLPGPIAPLENDWFAGPVGDEGWENIPPMRIHIFSETINIELSTSVHWPPWCLPESEEGKLFNSALDKLVAQGWTEPG